jgi:hypothetical protein
MNSIALLGSLLLSQVAGQSDPRIASLEGFTNVSDPYYGQSPPVYPTRKPIIDMYENQKITVSQLRGMVVLTQHGKMPTPGLVTWSHR